MTTAAVSEEDPNGKSVKRGIECLHTAAAANRNSHVADWAVVDGVDELVYASHKNLVFAKHVGSRHPPASQVVVTSSGTVTVVKYAHSLKSGQVPRVIAATADGFLHLFHRANSSTSGWNLTKSWQATESVTQRKAAHIPGKRPKPEDSASIQALGVLRPTIPWSSTTPDDITVIVSAASDGTMKVWTIDQDNKVELKQSATLGKSKVESKTEVLPLDIAIASLPSSSPSESRLHLLMAVAGTDGKVDFWLSEGDVQFRRLFAIAGHSDWVRALDFCRIQESQHPSLMLATGSQDHSVRLWRVQRSANANQSAATLRGDIDEFEKLAMQIEDNNEEETIATKAQSFTCNDARWNVSLDALLSGHEHWITGTRWAPLDGERQPAALLSSSADNSVILWTPSSSVTMAITTTKLPSFTPITQQEEDIWVSVQRFGELGSVGSAANGMYGVLWDPTVSSGNSRQAALAHGYGGAIQIWSRQLRDGKLESWKSQSGLGGHFAPSTCVRWEPNGEYYITGGLDKTTRLYGCFKDKDAQSWHEIARPQTHGFEIISLAWLSQLAFSSAGDEKIIRVLEAPKGFVQTMQTLSLSQSQPHTNKEAKEYLLAFRLPTLGHLVSPFHLTDSIKEVTRLSISTGAHITIAAISPIFDGFKDGKTLSLSFEQAENFLKWCYSLAWSIAIESDQLLFQVDVLFVGDDGLERLLKEQRQKQNHSRFFVVDEASCSISSNHLADAVVLKCNHPARPSEVKNDQDRLPQHQVIALGGTFDHLHVGHKILLSMAALCATRKVIVGVTDDSMLTKKKSAHLLEDVDERIKRVSSFLAMFRRPFYDLEREVVRLQDVAGPAGTVANIDALLFTDETVDGADCIDKERQKNGLNTLKRLSIGVIGAQGETELKNKDPSELAAAKVGSTAIRQWLDDKKTIPLDHVATLSGEERPLGASVPPLGLSNRSIYSTSKRITDGPSESGQPIGKAQESIASHLNRPPVEDELHNNTLWCEVTKLYGHSLELLSLDVDLFGGLIASSCKAKSGQLAIVLIHDRNKKWDQIQQLDGHSLDITRVRFSQDGKRLASVSRDRSWRIYKRQQDDHFHLLASLEEAHNRIIYDVAWTFDSKRFATASRDHLVKIWLLDEDHVEGQVKLSSTLTFTEPITAIAFTRNDRLAIGSERGNAFIYDYDEQKEEYHLVYHLASIHSEAISELAWRPEQKKLSEPMLVSSSLDGSVRLWRVPE